MAVDLLSLLPDSAFSKRMQERVQPLLKFIPAEGGSILKLKKGKKATLELILPIECTKVMRQDGVEPKPPTGIGEKMWWLIQMLKCVPLEFIENVLDASPGDILEATLNSEWSKRLLEVWCDAAIRQQNQSWCIALADATLAEARINYWTKLLRTLPLKERDEKLAVLFTDSSFKSRIYQVIEDLLANGHEEWSPTFSQQVIDWLKCVSSSAASEPGMWSFQQRISQIAPFLSAQALPAALQGWPTTTKGWEYWNNCMERFQAVVQFRLEMRTAIIGKE